MAVFVRQPKKRGPNNEVAVRRGSTVLLFSCHPIGQLCLGSQGCSSRTVIVKR